MGGVPPVLIAYLVSTAAYAGFQWTVQVVIYRQFPSVPAEAFAEYERQHQRRITVVVTPLFAALTVCVGWLAIDRPSSIGWWAVVLAVVLLAIILGSTAVGAVPMHRRLSAGWDDSAYRRLIRVDLVRAIAATAALVLAVVLIVQ